MNGLLSAEATVRRRLLALEVIELRAQLRALARRTSTLEAKQLLELDVDELRVLHASLVDAADALELVDPVLES